MENEDRIVQKETIKLTKNSKGYTWELKFFAENKDKLEAINQEYNEKYGGVTE